MASLKILDSPPSYTIAWIAALPIERAAAEAMLDEEHAAPTGLARHQTDTKVYKWGRVGEHNIVIAALASGVYRTTSAAITASSLLASLPSIRTGRLVALGGGVSCPDRGHDIRLGDIVLSQLYGTIGSVCQYYLIKAKLSDKCDRKGFLGCPPTVLLNALASIQDYHERKDSDVPFLLQVMLENNPKMEREPRKIPAMLTRALIMAASLKLHMTKFLARIVRDVTYLMIFNVIPERLPTLISITGPLHLATNLLKMLLPANVLSLTSVAIVSALI